MKTIFKNPFVYTLMLCSALAVGFSGCSNKDDDPLPEEDENELITTVRLTFTNKADAADKKTFTSSDPDGDGGANPTVQTVALKANATYTVSAEFLNESINPAEDITEEVKEESVDHLVVYKPSTVSGLTVTITDKDAKNLPIGLAADIKTGIAGIGTLQIILRHQPGVKNGTETPGSTDADATFPTMVQ